ncbi:porin family protein [Chitinophaga sp. MM2321]|uniref:porin family protein n=1 Tax=Chitinophaga sp. MM2321 TaxID=3137178 RepID=UPI0032D57F23
MKKRLLSAVAMVLFIISAARAQELHYGIKADLNLFKIDGEGIQSNYNPGVRLGVFATYDFTKAWGLQPELLFTQANDKKSDVFNARYVNTSNHDANSKIKLSYITIPLLIRYNINKLITVNAGPQYSFLFFSNENLLINNRDAFKRNDFGLVGGLTVSLHAVHFYGRYVVGITDLNNIDDRYKWKTQQAQIGVGINIK